MVPAEQPFTYVGASSGSSLVPRVLALALIALPTALAFALGLHHQISLEALLHHRAGIDAFVAGHAPAAIAAYVGIYVCAVALSLPGSAILTISGGLLFGTVAGALAAICGATAGAVIIFLIARSALGGWITCRAGPRLARLAAEFRADAFSYLFFLRLIPVFPFWLVNLVAAVGGVALGPFVAATAMGMVPATFAFALFGSGLDSALAAQLDAYRDCLAAGGPHCQLDFHLEAAMTPQLIAAFVALGVLALLPVVARHSRTMRQRISGGPND